MSNSFAAPWTVAHQAPLSMGFPRQGYCSRSLFPSSGDLPDLVIETLSLPDSLPLRHQGELLKVKLLGLWVCTLFLGICWVLKAFSWEDYVTDNQQCSRVGLLPRPQPHSLQLCLSASYRGSTHGSAFGKEREKSTHTWMQSHLLRFLCLSHIIW